MHQSPHDPQARCQASQLAAPDADITLGRPAGSDDARTGDDGVMGHLILLR